MSKLARALALLVAAATACSTFGEESPSSDGGSDASIQPPADGGGDSTADVVAVADVVADVVNDYAGCVPLVNVTDGFDRTTVGGGSWSTPMTGNGGTLAAELTNFIEGPGSLKVAFLAGSDMDAFLPRSLDAAACKLTLSFLLRAAVLPDGTGSVTLASILFDGSSKVRLVLKANGELVVRENDNPGSINDTTLGTVTKGSVHQVEMSLDTVAGEVGWFVGLKDVPATTSGTAKLQSAHAGPRTMRFGGTNGESQLPFDYVLDRFSLK